MPRVRVQQKLSFGLMKRVSRKWSCAFGLKVSCNHLSGVVDEGCMGEGPYGGMQTSVVAPGADLTEWLRFPRSCRDLAAERDRRKRT